jgi:quercetin dioxygenase-like cupin family protein
MAHPIISISCVANLWSRMMHFKKTGDIELGHTHAFDHLTLLASGSLEVTANENVTIFNAPHMIYIRKDVNHKLVALEDNTVAYCIHALRENNKTGDIIDPNSVPLIKEKISEINLTA